MATSQDDPCQPPIVAVISNFLDLYFQGKAVNTTTNTVIYNDLATLANVVHASNYKTLSGTFQIRNLDPTKSKPSLIQVDHTKTPTWKIVDSCDNSDKTPCPSLLYQVDFDPSNVWNKFMAFVTQQWYFQNYDGDNPWTPVIYLMDFDELISSGESAKPMDTSNYTGSLLRKLIDYYSKQDGNNASSLTDVLQSFYGDPNLGTYFQFPFVQLDSNNNIVLNVPFVNTCTNLDKTFTNVDNMKDYLAQFYQDSIWGSYLANETNSYKVMNPCTVQSIQSSVSKVDVTITSGKNSYHTQYSVAKVTIQMSFMCMLRAFVDPTHNSDISSLTADEWNKNTVTGLPVPVSKTRFQGCQPSDKVCNCTYFSLIDSYECPGWQYYFCQYFPSCKCTVTRAVPEILPIETRINNKFGLCFDLNCPATRRPTDCSDQCALAKEWFSNKNWAMNFVNPEAVNIDLIEKTCNISIPQFSFTANAYFWTWQIICGAVCMFLTVPILVGMESFVKEKFSLRFVHILSFLMLAAMAVVFGYALVGVQVCDDFGDNNQAKCMDRLTQTIKLNHADCDVQNPMFCQCSAKREVKKTCYQLGFASCKCQNNQICMPNDGSADIVTPVKSNIRMLRWQLLYFCLGLYLLVACSMGVGVFFLTNKKGSVGYVPTVSLATNVVLHLVVYVFLFALMVIFPVVWKYGREYEQSLEIDPNKQRQMCVPSKNV